MPQIKLCLDIDVQNYHDIARNRGGLGAGLLSRLPLSRALIKSKINDGIVAEIQKKLGVQVADRLKAAMHEKGVRVNVTHRYL